MTNHVNRRFEIDFNGATGGFLVVYFFSGVWLK